MKLKVLLAAPTSRAAQRMTDVIGRESKTIHRLLGWKPEGFKKNEEDPLEVDFLITGFPPQILYASFISNGYRSISAGTVKYRFFRP